ncbi:MAG TPA: sporulation protein YqfD [Peptococcaceae bacterium]|jgi:similar to stage IV sporulation protein|nr:sporulation protein YqfD [Peptococcaceae bacterium]HPZ70691.1 sporulation protein YqfD [Peptococcaceae bacterium]HQD54075.1 sporulation protein YqfD [Peptococcaceae bacterium]
MKWISGLSGYVEVALQGSQPERIINMALSRGITIWDIRQEKPHQYRLKVSVGGYKAFRSLIRRSSCRVKLLQKKGIPFYLMKAKRRKVLVFGTFFFCLSLYFFSSFVWVVEVTGNKLVPAELILTKSQELGLKRGVPQKAVDCNELAESLLLEIPELSWVGIRGQGTKMIIEVAEKTFPPADDEKKPADLVARVDGVIEEILVMKGTPLVQEGDPVEKGQLLIAGYVYPQIIVAEDGQISPGGEPEAVRAKGVVRARVSRSKKMYCPIQETVLKDTGAEMQTICLNFGGKEIYLRGTKEAPYAHFRSIRQVKPLLEWKGRNLQGTVELITIVYKEQNCETHYWGIEGAFQEAARRAHEALRRELPQDYKIVNRSAEPIPWPDKGAVALKYVLETVENIGTYPQR